MSGPVTGGGGCDGNAAPYVLGALTEAETAAFTEHLADCAVCREEVAALRSVAAALPAAAPQFVAPPELKRRLFAEIDAEARVSADSGRVRAGSRRRRTLSLPVFGRLAPAGAGFALAAVVAAVLVIALGGSGGSSSRVVRAAVSAPGASATVTVNGGHAELKMAHMPQTQRGRVYQVWLKGSGGPIPTDALFTVSADGSATVGIPGGVHGVREVMVTSEPLGGSLAPTRSPVIIARLS